MPFFIIPPLFSFCRLCQNSLLLIIRWLPYLWVILSASNLSQVLSVGLVPVYLCVSLCLPGDSLMPLSLSHAGLIASNGCLLTSSEFYLSQFTMNIGGSICYGAQRAESARTRAHTCDLLLCVSPLENRLFSTVHTLQSIDSQLGFACCWFWLQV